MKSAAFAKLWAENATLYNQYYSYEHDDYIAADRSSLQFYFAEKDGEAYEL